MDNYKCTGCGEERSESFKFCPKCGKEHFEESKSLDGQLVNLLRQGQKIQAVKLYRERSGLGLKEAHEYVQSLAQQNNILLKTSASGVVVLVIFALIVVGGIGLAVFALIE